MANLLLPRPLMILLLIFSSFSLLSLAGQFPASNHRLDNAYKALQAWKHSITCDPKHVTADWCGPHVCNYTGVYCAPLPGGDPHEITVAGIDLYHYHLCGTLPEELGLLSDLAVFHINSNKFTGSLPSSFYHLKLLHELDVSNNLLSGEFPSVLLRLPSLRYLDLRYNKFCGDVPDAVFDLKLDALFINHNDFRFSLPKNLGNSPVSVLVIAGNVLSGCFPKSIMKMAKTLNQLIIMNSNFSSCLPPYIGNLTELTVLDLSFNNLAGMMPESIGEMMKLEQLDVAHNRITGGLPEGVCEMQSLKNLTFSYNYLDKEPDSCSNIKTKDDQQNCLPKRMNQRTEEACLAVERKPVFCDSVGCIALPPTPPPPPY